MNKSLIMLILFDIFIFVLSFLDILSAPLLILVVLVVNGVVYYTQLKIQKDAHEIEFLKLQSTSRHLEKSTQVQSSQIETIVSNLPFPIALLDLKGQFSLTNSFFDRFYFDAQSPRQFDDVGKFDEVLSFLRVAYIKEETLIRNMQLEQLDYQAISVPIYNGNRYNGCLVMFLDISSVLEGERMQKRFIADASHELKTPLTSILGMVEILNRPQFNDSKVLVEFLGQIEVEARRMDQLLKDLLSLSRQSNTKALLDKQLYAASKLIESALYSVSAAIRENGNTAVVDCHQEIMLNVDKEKFYQILTNLLINASKYTFNGVITIKAYEDKLFTYIDVSDTGIGISSEDQSHIFDRFFRSDASRSRSSGGSGLGLAIVKTYVNMHRGEVNVISQLDKGSRFQIKLPK